jgi:hypothetical protein
VLLLYFVAAGILVGLLTHGRLQRLTDVSFRWAPLALAGLVLQVVLFSAPVATVIGGFGVPLYVGSTAAVMVALLHNRALPGFPIIALGAALNLVAILANGGEMPASPGALAALGGVSVGAGQAFTNSLVGAVSTPFALLGDVFVLPRPIPFANVFSIGDAVIGLGAVSFLVQLMRGAVLPSADPVPSRGGAVTVSSGTRRAENSGARGVVPRQVPPSPARASAMLGAEAVLDG